MSACAKPARSHDRAYLIGLSGSGKSAVARLAAARLGWQASDSDAEIVRRAGMPIAGIFEQRGEAAFRALERAVVLELAARPRQVLALGGGAFLDPVVQPRLLAGGLVVWLQVSPAQAAARLAPTLAHEPRPLLGDDPAGRLRELLSARQPEYQRAHVHLPTDGRSPGELAEAVVSALRSRASKGAD
jgi:shikimate kinase